VGTVSVTPPAELPRSSPHQRPSVSISGKVSPSYERQQAPLRLTALFVVVTELGFQAIYRIRVYQVKHS
jgi:hypothetical protein